MSITVTLYVLLEVPEFDKHLKKAGRHIGQKVVEITIKMKTIVQKLLMINSVVVLLFIQQNRSLKNY